MVYETLKELSAAVAAGEVAPSELVQVSLERLREYGPELRCVVTLVEEAVEEARGLDAEAQRGRLRGPLHGVPWGAKDLLATRCAPTTWGAYPLRNQWFNYDATVVERLREAGAVLVAKLAMIELAGGMGYRQPNASFTGPCATPWSLKHWAGGSSSGSGAAVAAGLVPFAIGSETWGSILSPSNNCGVTGLRPTYGRVSRFGAMALSWTLDKLGPLCLSAEDCGLVLEAIAGPDQRDPSTHPKGWRYAPREGEFKLGIPKGVLEGRHQAVAENFQESLRVLEGFCVLEEVEFPEFPYVEVTRTILNCEAASAFESFVAKGLDRMLTAPEDRYGHYPRTQIPATDYLRALRLRSKMCVLAEKLLEGLDALVAPTSMGLAPPIDKPFPVRRPWAHKDIMGALGNGAGLPAVTVPNGFSEEGLPTGIQFMGHAYGENTILGIAKAYQEKTHWHRLHPPRYM